jgi:hypothetical protein
MIDKGESPCYNLSFLITSKGKTSMRIRKLLALIYQMPDNEKRASLLRYVNNNPSFFVQSF